MTRRTLHEIFLANGGLKTNKWIHYFDIYERHLRRFVDKAPTMLEIGVAGGGSLRLWKEYFGEGATIVGLDIKPACSQFKAPGIEIVIGSQSDPDVMADILSRHQIDIVLDDGSHMMSDIKASFELLYDHISPCGLYMIEDLHTCYKARYNGGLKAPGSFIEFVKEKIDELHFNYTGTRYHPTAFTVGTASINVYDSITVFERSPQGQRQAVVTRAMEIGNG